MGRIHSTLGHSRRESWFLFENAEAKIRQLEKRFVIYIQGHPFGFLSLFRNNRLSFKLLYSRPVWYFNPCRRPSFCRLLGRLTWSKLWLKSSPNSSTSACSEPWRWRRWKRHQPWPWPEYQSSNYFRTMRTMTISDLQPIQVLNGWATHPKNYESTETTRMCGKERN